MKIQVTIEAHLVDPAGNGIDLSHEELEEFGEELETILESAFRKRPHATENHNQVLLAGTEAEVAPI